MPRADGIILSYRTDEHALAVLSVLPAHYRPLLVDVGREGVDFVTSLSDRGRMCLLTRNGSKYDLNDVKFWWRRRPRFQPQPETGVDYRAAQEAEVTHFWQGVFGLRNGAHWCNAPQAHSVAQNKISQIFMAKECGLKTPRTLWSNDPEAIKSFWQACGERAIIKMFEGSEKMWQPTRLLTPDDIEHRSYMRFSHSIVQEVVEGDMEYRVVIFGDNIFAVVSNVGKSRYPFDTRIDTAIRREKVRIDDRLAHSLLEFRRRSGLSYCAFDVRESHSGEPIFLENNPMGQFLYLDRVYEGKIVKAFADFMSGFGTGSAEDSLGHCVEHQWDGFVGMPSFAVTGRTISHIID